MTLGGVIEPETTVPGEKATCAAPIPLTTPTLLLLTHLIITSSVSTLSRYLCFFFGQVRQDIINYGSLSESRRALA